jgi:acetyl-CoA acetyltransferase
VAEVLVLGAAVTRLGPPGASCATLARLAAETALRRAGLAQADVPAVFVGAGGVSAQVDAVAVRLGLRELGFRGDERVEHVSPSAAEALHRGWRAIEMDVYGTVLCVGAGARDPSPWPGEAVLKARAEAARQYMAASGATADHLARTAAKNLRHGALGEEGGAAASVEQVLGSELLAWPLTRLMVANSGEGAAAVVLGGGGDTAAPRLKASLLVEPDGQDEGAARAARLAYETAGLGPEDIDCAELDDVTAAAELAAYEELQLAPPGQGPELIDAGFTALGGVLPVNTSGGLLSQGELTGISGFAQICELASQLRGEAGARQVDGARVGLAHSEANGLVSVAILTSPARGL